MLPPPGAAAAAVPPPCYYVGSNTAGYETCPDGHQMDIDECQAFHSWLHKAENRAALGYGNRGINTNYDSALAPEVYMAYGCNLLAIPDTNIAVQVAYDEDASGTYASDATSSWRVACMLPDCHTALPSPPPSSPSCESPYKILEHEVTTGVCEGADRALTLDECDTFRAYIQVPANAAILGVHSTIHEYTSVNNRNGIGICSVSSNCASSGYGCQIRQYGSTSKSGLYYDHSTNAATTDFDFHSVCWDSQCAPSPGAAVALEPAAAVKPALAAAVRPSGQPRPGRVDLRRDLP